MNKKVCYLFFFLFFILLTSCSFDKVTGIWSGSEKERQRISELEREQKQLVDSVQIYSSKTIYSKEINSTKSAILTAAKSKSSWKMPGSNLQNFKGNIYLPSIDNNFLRKKIGKNKFLLSKVMQSPLFFKDNIIFADDKGTIFNISKRGKVNWKRNIYLKVYKKIYKNLSYSIYEDKIYVVDNIGFIYAISFDTGELIWIKNHGIPLRSKLKVFKNKLFVINQDNRLFCLDAKDGSKIWDIRTISSFIKSQNLLSLVITKEEDIVMINSSGDLLKIQSKNGRIYWSLNITGSMFDDTDFFKSSDIVTKDEDIILSTGSSTFSFNLKNGYLNWEQEVGSLNTPIIDRNNVFLVTNNGYFVNLDRLSGKIIWSVNILKILKAKKRNTKVTGFALGSGKIYAVTMNGYLIICSASSGQIENVKKIGDTITSAPIIASDSLYILTEESRILGFN